MHHQDRIEAEQRRAAAAFTTRIARRRFRTEIRQQGITFRAWARRTYNDFACAGKLAGIVKRPEA